MTWAAASRAEQGLAAKITDHDTLLRAAALVGAQLREGRGPPGGHGTGRRPAKRSARPSTPLTRSTQRNASSPPQAGQDGTSVRGGGGHAR
jgi:hypothetical protein